MQIFNIIFSITPKNAPMVQMDRTYGAIVIAPMVQSNRTYGAIFKQPNTSKTRLSKVLNFGLPPINLGDS